MLSLYGINYSIKNIYLLSKRFSEKKIENNDDLRCAYLNFLSYHQPRQPVNYSDNKFIYDSDVSDRLKLIYQPSSLNDMNQNDIIGDLHSENEIERLSSMISEAKELLTYEYRFMVDLIIHSFFFRKTRVSGNTSSFGGSSSTAIGVVWISGHGKLTKYDIAEFLVHELTHHLLFIDERCHQQFFYKEMQKKENYAISALLVRARPLDKVIHSIVVSSEILNSRRCFLGENSVSIHPNTQNLRQNTLNSIEDVRKMLNRDAVITEHTLDIINRCEEVINSHENFKVAI